MSNITLSSPVVPVNSFPVTCFPIQVSLLQTMDSSCAFNCLDDPQRDLLEIFPIPVEATNCGEFEEELCEYSSCCLTQRGQMNRLYRCIIRNLDTSTVPELAGVTISDQLIDFARTCPLSCLEDNYDIGGPTISPQPTFPPTTAVPTTPSPTFTPTTGAPTFTPTTAVPTTSPSDLPSDMPSEIPSDSPSAPTTEPSSAPSKQPTPDPTTSAPTSAPLPTPRPTTFARFGSLRGPN